MNWFTRAKTGYLEDLDWIAEAAAKLRAILSDALDAQSIRTSVAKEIAGAQEGYIDRREMHWVLERRQDSSIDLFATKGSDPNNLKRECWNGHVAGYERYEGLHLTLIPSGEIAVSAEPHLGQRLEPHAVRARNGLAKRIGFFDLDAMVGRWKG